MGFLRKTRSPSFVARAGEKTAIGGEGNGKKNTL
jgi:hypothetical protein